MHFAFNTYGYFITFLFPFLFLKGAKIQLERDSDPNLNGLKRVKLSGSSSQIEYAKLLVDEKVEISKKMMARDQLKGIFSLFKLYVFQNFFFFFYLL